MKKNIVVVIVLLIVAGGGSFYAGVTYGKNQATATRTTRFSGPVGAAGRFGGGAGRVGGGAVNGSVLSIGATSLTVEQADGSGSKIVFISSSTPFMHTVEAPLSELKIGDRIVVAGTADASGAITAQSIQIRPSTSTFPGSAQLRTN